jgi:pilus assembly protein CpaB
MSSRIILAFVGALIISGGFTVVLGRKITRSRQHEQPMVRYAMAARSIDLGEIVKANDISFMDWPAAKPIDGAFQKTEDAIGRSAIYPMEKGQIVLNKYLAPAGAGIGLTTKIDEGMRAVALKSDDVVGVAGFLFPGSRVDVLVTYRSAESPEPVTVTVLQDVQVLAVGHQVQPNPDGKPASVNVVTVLAQPKDAERLVLASTQGSVYFTLRNGGDHQQSANIPVALKDLDGVHTIKKITQNRVVQAVPKKYVVETVAGDKQSSAVFN